MTLNQNAGYGQAVMAHVHNLIGPTFGRIFAVFSASDYADPNYYDYVDILKTDLKGKVRFLNTFEEAEDAVITNNNDVILLDAHSTHTIANGIAWDKNRVHVIGMDGGDRLIQQGSKVQSTAAAADAYVIKVTGVRNSFRNLKFIQVDTDAAALTVAQFGGEGNLVKNCSFVFGVSNNLSGTTTYEVLCGEDSGTFLNCTFGADTLVTSGARAVLAFNRVTTGQECKSSIFKDCIFQICSSSTSADFIRVLATNALLFTTTMRNPIFNNAICAAAGGVALDDAIRSVSGLTGGNLFVVNPASNCTELCTDVTDQVKVIGYGMDGTNPDQKIGIGLTPA